MATTTLPAASVKIFGSPTTPETARVLTCLFEKEIKFELIRVDTYYGPKHISEFKLQPRLETITFNDGFKTLADSRKICHHIAEAYPEQGNRHLLGVGTLERASIEQWLQMEASSFDPSSSELLFSLAYLPLPPSPDKESTFYSSRSGKPHQPNGKQITAAAEQLKLLAKEEERTEEVRELAEKRRKELELVLDVYNQRLEEVEFLAGDEFSLADLVHLPNAQEIAKDPRSRGLLESRAHVNRWWREISSRPTWKRVLDLQH